VEETAVKEAGMRSFKEDNAPSTLKIGPHEGMCTTGLRNILGKRFKT